MGRSWDFNAREMTPLKPEDHHLVEVAYKQELGAKLELNEVNESKQKRRPPLLHESLVCILE
eukprot:scaffold8508_cov161-Skeletonema_marinoi.AAC.2